MGASSSAKTALLWILTVIITLGSAVYQRTTGPTYPVSGSTEIVGQKISYRLLRSHETSSDALIEINVPDKEINGEIKWRRFKSHDQWITEPLVREGDDLSALIPKQPMAGKVSYLISLIDQEGNNHPLTEEPVIIRFKGAVPLYILIPHVLFMFTGMLLATRTGFEGIFNGNNKYRLTLLTTILLFIGGLILGPLVQKFAFDAFWTGWPFGHDLTDNKTVVAVIVWLVALWRVKVNRGARAWIIIAAVVTLLVFMIPHSLLGSEIDYTQVEQAPN